MATTEQNRLKAELATIQNWTDEQSVMALQASFFSLLELDREANATEWAAIKTALAENKALKDIDVREFLTRKDLSKQGAWWFNPGNW